MSARFSAPTATPSITPRDAQGWLNALHDWFLTQAMPRWWRDGTDHLSGGFYEKISFEGRALDEPRRTRVTARQIYVFTVAHHMGWSGPALDGVQHGVDFLLKRQRQPDGTFASSVTPQGKLVDSRFDLYEQAFALFALASAYATDSSMSPLRAVADELYHQLHTHWKHPVFGFEESRPASTPLRSNPHMHLLEAVLAWSKLGSTEQRATWQARAEELVQLCLARLIDPATGALRERFDALWSPLPTLDGRIIEPGHQFEWGWLLMQWQAMTGLRADCQSAAERLIHIGERWGVGAQGAVVNELLDDFSVHDATAKLWPQTERIKAWTTMVLAAQQQPEARTLALRHVATACKGLSVYLEGAPPGLWHELMLPDGQMAGQPSKASSLYHIACAIQNLHEHRALMA